LGDQIARNMKNLLVLILLVAVLFIVTTARQKPTIKNKNSEDESIQAYVLHKARQLGYGLRIIPKMRDFFLGKSTKHSKENIKKKSVKSKKKLSDYRRPSRQTAHVNDDNNKIPWSTRTSKNKVKGTSRNKKEKNKYIEGFHRNKRKPKTVSHGLPKRPSTAHIHHTKKTLPEIKPFVHHHHFGTSPSTFHSSSVRFEPFHHHEALPFPHDPLAPIHTAHQVRHTQHSSPHITFTTPKLPQLPTKAATPTTGRYPKFGQTLKPFVHHFHSTNSNPFIPIFKSKQPERPRHILNNKGKKIKARPHPHHYSTKLKGYDIVLTTPEPYFDSINDVIYNFEQQKNTIKIHPQSVKGHSIHTLQEFNPTTSNILSDPVYRKYPEKSGNHKRIPFTAFSNSLPKPVPNKTEKDQTKMIDSPESNRNHKPSQNVSRLAGHPQTQKAKSTSKIISKGEIFKVSVSTDLSSSTLPPVNASSSSHTLSNDSLEFVSIATPSPEHSSTIHPTSLFTSPSPQPVKNEGSNNGSSKLSQKSKINPPQMIPEEEKSSEHVKDVLRNENFKSNRNTFFRDIKSSRPGVKIGFENDNLINIKEEVIDISQPINPKEESLTYNFPQIQGLKESYVFTQWGTGKNSTVFTLNLINDKTKSIDSGAVNEDSISKDLMNADKKGTDNEREDFSSQKHISKSSNISKLQKNNGFNLQQPKIYFPSQTPSQLKFIPIRPRPFGFNFTPTPSPFFPSSPSPLPFGPSFSPLKFGTSSPTSQKLLQQGFGKPNIFIWSSPSPVRIESSSKTPPKSGPSSLPQRFLPGASPSPLLFNPFSSTRSPQNFIISSTGPIKLSPSPPTFNPRIILKSPSPVRIESTPKIPPKSSPSSLPLKLLPGASPSPQLFNPFSSTRSPQNFIISSTGPVKLSPSPPTLNPKIFLNSSLGISSKDHGPSSISSLLKPSNTFGRIRISSPSPILSTISTNSEFGRSSPTQTISPHPSQVKTGQFIPTPSSFIKFGSRKFGPISVTSPPQFFISTSTSPFRHGSSSPSSSPLIINISTSTSKSPLPQVFNNMNISKEKLERKPKSQFLGFQNEIDSSVFVFLRNKVNEVKNSNNLHQDFSKATFFPNVPSATKLEKQKIESNKKPIGFNRQLLSNYIHQRQSMETCKMII
jgi:hypothetical protein